MQILNGPNSVFQSRNDADPNSDAKKRREANSNQNPDENESKYK